MLFRPSNIDSYLHTWVWYTVKYVGTRIVRKKTIISGSQALLNLAFFGTTKIYIFFWFLFQNPNAESLGSFTQSHLFYWNESLQQRIYQHAQTHHRSRKSDTHHFFQPGAANSRRCVSWKIEFQFVWNFVMFHNQHFICIIFNLILNMVHSRNFFHTILSPAHSLSFVCKPGLEFMASVAVNLPYNMYGNGFQQQN